MGRLALGVLALLLVAAMREMTCSSVENIQQHVQEEDNILRPTAPGEEYSAGDREGDVVIGQKTLREKLGIDVMAQLKASVLKAQGHQDGAGMDLTARSVGEPNDGDVLQATMAVIAFVPGGDAPGDVYDEVALTLPS